MARKKLPLRLLPLPRTSPFSAQDHKTDRLLRLMRENARRNQKKEEICFYPLTQVAAWFHVPVSMVAAVYAQLENEGLVRRIRGSKTALQGRSASRMLKARGIVAMPVSISNLIRLPKYRLCLMAIGQELGKQGFVITYVFFEESERDPVALTERIAHSDVDTVLWYLPDKCAKESALRLRDRGIRVVGLSEGAFKPIPSQYKIQRERALTSILDDWQNNREITCITIIRGDWIAYQDAMVEALFRERGMPLVVKSFSDLMKSEDDLTGSGHNTGIILLSSAASLLSLHAPEILCHLVERYTVAFIDGPVSIFSVNISNAPVDLVAVNWHIVAKRITGDLIARTNFAGEARIFEAEAHLQAPFRQYAQPV